VAPQPKRPARPGAQGKFLGLTGGLGAGKSEALRLLEELGAATLSTDAVVHELLATDVVRDEVVARLGPGVLRNGALDRSAIAARVFGDDEARAWLEGVLWPRVGERVAAWRAEVGDDRIAVVEVPLLFESGMEEVFDSTIAVVADEEVRERRAAARGHASVAGRAGRQLRQAEKAERADFTVRNDGSLEELRQSLSQVLERLEST
jgi:dephospho-CoA kinase